MKNKQSESKSTKTPWPTKAAMDQVYEMNLWGTDGTAFYSGEGSHHPKFLTPYVEVLISFLKSFDNPLVVCDLGCGDFNVGKYLVDYAQAYIAVDIVEELIRHNKKTYSAENLEFHCLDIAEDDLPVGDCVIIRQVLQHLSNSEIHKILNKLAHFKYVILTEHLPKEPFTPNLDIISGQGIRLKKGSGVDVLAPPFNFKIKSQQQLVSVPLNDGQGVLVTTCYTVF